MRMLVLLLGLMLAPAFPATADGKRDHERARAALAAGEIRPLSELLAVVERGWIGRVIETELERSNGRWIYEFKLLPPSGRVFEVQLDAATGELVRVVGPGQERR